MNTNKICYKMNICLYKLLYVSTPINYFTLQIWCVLDRASLWQLKNKNQLDGTYVLLYLW